MRFGQVEGVIEELFEQGTKLRLRVFLDTGNEWRTVRDEIVPVLTSQGQDGDLSWQVDQYTQETIGVDLAEEGWEVIGATAIPPSNPGELARSATYAVRLL